MRCLYVALVAFAWILGACASEAPDAALPHLQEGEAGMAEGRPAHAADAYRLALEASPGDLRAFRGLLEAFVALGDAELALAALEELEARDPEPVDPCPALALGRGEALARRSVGAGCAGARARLARLLTSKAAHGDREAAIDSLAEAIELDPSDPGRFELAAALLIDRGRVEQAIALLSSGLERHPEDRDLADLMVRALSIR